MWYLILFTVRDIISKSIKRSLFHLLLILTSLSYQNLFSIICLTVNFIESLFQHILMNVEDVVSQAISVKIVQSPKSINQLRFKRLSSDLTISSFVKILKHNISAAVIMMISQKII